MNDIRITTQRLAAPLIIIMCLFVFSSLACDIDQNFGDLSVDTPRSFAPAVAEHHSWTASVIPDTRYEVIIKATQGELNESNSLWVKDEKGKATYGYAQGAITSQNSLNLIFTSSGDGKILILFIPGRGEATCTIEFHKL